MNYEDLVNHAWSQVPRSVNVKYFNLVWVYGRVYSLNLINGGTKCSFIPEEAKKRLEHYEDVYRRILRC